jgi:hypothetical protein
MTQLRHWLRDFGAMRNVQLATIRIVKCLTSYSIASSAMESTAGGTGLGTPEDAAGGPISGPPANHIYQSVFRKFTKSVLFWSVRPRLKRWS